MRDIKEIGGYCTKCGRALVLGKKKLEGYNSVTGAPEFKVEVKCPKAFWAEFVWDFGHFHREYSVYDRSFWVLYFNGKEIEL